MNFLVFVLPKMVELTEAALVNAPKAQHHQL